MTKMTQQIIGLIVQGGDEPLRICSIESTVRKDFCKGKKKARGLGSKGKVV